jgi:hypothetical protein
VAYPYLGQWLGLVGDPPQGVKLNPKISKFKISKSENLTRARRKSATCAHKSLENELCSTETAFYLCLRRNRPGSAGQGRISYIARYLQLSFEGMPTRASCQWRCRPIECHCRPRRRGAERPTTSAIPAYLFVTADCAYRSPQHRHPTLLYHSRHDRSREGRERKEVRLGRCGANR